MEAKLELGAPGSFEVRVDGDVVASRKRFMFPSEDEIVGAVKAALTR